MKRELLPRLSSEWVTTNESQFPVRQFIERSTYSHPISSFPHIFKDSTLLFVKRINIPIVGWTVSILLRILNFNSSDFHLNINHILRDSTHIFYSIIISAYVSWPHIPTTCFQLLFNSIPFWALYTGYLYNDTFRGVKVMWGVIPPSISLSALITGLRPKHFRGPYKLDFHS
jgi:hypothetical protein